jgi:SAM-dependent methyltransferase
MSPLCETYLTVDELDRMEPFYPLNVRVCGSCFLVQLPEYVPPEEIFSEYAYFSGYSDTWVEHARRYCDAVIDRFQLGPTSMVVEIASNDGYLLQHMVARGIPSLGIEPAANVAAAARQRGVETLVAFFGAGLARRLVAEGIRADLVVANNVLSQVPDLHDFVSGLKTILSPGGVLTLEFHHLLRLIEGRQFDTIYHEHFSYFSLRSARALLAAHGLRVFDVDELPTHGGSLRLYVCHDDDSRPDEPAVTAVATAEEERGLSSLDGYATFSEAVAEVKRDLLSFLISARREGRLVAGYGAPGKGNTLLNYCGIRSDLLEFTVDRNPYKHGRFLPGTHIPIYPPDKIFEVKPDFILILPWNIKQEIMDDLAATRDWGARFVVAIPRLEIIS